MTTKSYTLKRGTKLAIMVGMAKRPAGATEAQICRRIGWKACRVTLRRTCDKLGLKLENREGRYFAVERRKPAARTTARKGPARAAKKPDSSTARKAA